jgi:hypothetical protein
MGAYDDVTFRNRASHCYICRAVNALLVGVPVCAQSPPYGCYIVRLVSSPGL